MSLRREIAEQIATEGPITVERYMGLALSHPKHGYYRSRDPFGLEGDFITAPEISQMFGELIGLWAVDCWARMGEPERLALVELGPGRGTLMADALRAARLAPRFLEAARIHLVETSEFLRARQSETVERANTTHGPISWHESFAQTPEGPLILIANEFFDALPIRQYLRDTQGWRERLIGLDDEGSLSFGLSGETVAELRLAAPQGSVLEIGSAGMALSHEIAARLVAFGGAALIIDYGHTQQGFGDTLQAVRRHQFVDPLEAPGETDLTAHVDFTSLGNAAMKEGALRHGPVTQRQFLRELGIEARAGSLKQKASEAQAASIDSALVRLIGDAPGAMGTLFKAMALSSPTLTGLAGFGSLTEPEPL
ncbi:MAG: SAM-dependent methyltransferase [Hyphomicrobiales bacterium]|nr:SAM-dependent methyltransferase [Hyphomicrobiales bacterium]